MIVVLVTVAPTEIPGQLLTAPYSSEECGPCAAWNETTDPVHIHGDSYWVGTRQLGAVLVTSDEGHVLIDGGLPNSAPLIRANVTKLGFSVDDVVVLLNSHPHFDHAGGLAALQDWSGAEAYATAASARALRSGAPVEDDPQYEVALTYPPVAVGRILSDGDTVQVGGLSLVAHETPGHSPGGTTWAWQSCDADGCVQIVYADSQTPVSAAGYRFSLGDRADRFRNGLAKIAELRCDILVTPHPGASEFWVRVANLQAEASAVRPVDPPCRRYAERYFEQLERRLERERGSPRPRPAVRGSG